MVIPAFYPAFDYGGPIPVAINSAKRLISRGHEVTVWTTNLVSIKGDKLGNQTEVHNVEGIRTVYLNSIAHYRWTGIAPDIFRYARRDLADFDVVQIYGFREFLTLVMAWWSRRIGKPYVLRTLGTIPRVTRSRTKKLLFDTIFGSSILHNAAALIAQTPADRRTCLDAGIPSEKVVLIPNGMDIPPELEQLKGGEFRREHGIADDEFLFLFVGRIHPVKGVDLLVRAFAKLGRQARLAVVGPDEGYQRKIEQLARKKGLGKAVIFTGPLYGARKWAAYKDADVYVLPSIYENFPATVLEAMTCSTPVITTENCGLTPQIRDRAGLAVLCDEESLAQAMQRLLDEPRLRDELALGGRRLLEEQFSWDPIVKMLEDLYERVVSANKLDSGSPGYERP
jgi:glycosyltransferase involved in cell wall biosynthesis